MALRSRAAAAADPRISFVAHDGRRAVRLTELLGDDDPRRPNARYLASATVSGFLPPATSTAFEGIEARFEPDAAPRNEVDDLEVGPSPDIARTRLRHALELTLAARLGTARRVAVLTGGGLDSGGLLALTHAWAQRRGRECFAVSMDFAGPDDDRPFLRALEAKLGCDVARVPPEDGARFIDAVMRGVDHAPLGWPTAAIELAAYERARTEGADCVVTGLGGDEMLDGERRALAGWFREGKPLRAWRAARDLRDFLPVDPHPVRNWLIRPLMAEAIPRWLRKRSVPPVTIEPWAGPVLRQVCRDERASREARLPTSARGLNRDRTAERNRQQVEIAAGVRREDPFLDPSFKGFMARVPAHWLLLGDIRRGLFREALKDLLPDALYRREGKADFEPALIRLVEAAGGFGRFRKLADVACLAELGIVEPPTFRAEFERMAANPSDGTFWPRVWRVLVVEAFARAQFGSRS